MPGKESAIPVGTQFSPNLIDLREFLRVIVQRSGDKSAMEHDVWRTPVRLAPVAKAPTRRRASLPLEAAAQYGLLERGTYEATELARDLAKKEPPELYDAFARHILLERGGLRVVEAVQQMRAEQLEITSDTLAVYLSERGFPVSEHNTAINSLRMWLAKADIFPDRRGGWEVDTSRKEALVGLNDEQIAALAGLSKQQRAFAITLCLINPPYEVAASEIRNAAETNFDVRFKRGNLRPVLEPLAEMGLIEFASKGTAGVKTARLRTTPSFNTGILQPFLEHAVKDLDTVLNDYFRMSPEEIYADLESDDKYVKGRALEAFAIRIMRLMHFEFVDWRLRARESGFSEVDVTMKRVVGGVATRWQVQCKNTPGAKVRLDDVAKEVGVALITKATHIMFIANNVFTTDAEKYAIEVMKQTPLSIYLLGRTDFEKIKARETALMEILDSKAREINALKREGSIWSG